MNCEPTLLSLVQTTFALLYFSCSVLIQHDLRKERKRISMYGNEYQITYIMESGQKPSITLSRYQTLRNHPFITCSISNAL